jgi:DNA excision repair protein ERCC-2
VKTYHLALRDFAVPSPRSGSIEGGSGSPFSMEKGQEIHSSIQQRRKAEHPDYLSEVKVVQQFTSEDFLFIVEGRIDGIFSSVPSHIEEIKSSFNIWELSKTLKKEKLNHPYYLQLLSYGYFHWLKTETIPKLSFHLVSSRNGDSLDIEIKLKVDEYEQWLKRRLAELSKEARLSEKRVKRRIKNAAQIVFPFEQPRSGQMELIQTIEEGLKNQKRLLLQAPTGLGKTIGVLYPALKEALARGQKTIYLTPKNSQHTVAEEAIQKFQDQGCKVKSLTLTAKSKLCMKPEPICNPEFCEYARDYYDKLNQHNLRDVLSSKRKLTAKTFKKLGEEFEVCPFELQLESLKDVDAVICDYNYVFGPKSSLGKLSDSTLAESGLPNMIIDEAHNLSSRAMSYFSPALSLNQLYRMKEEMLLLPEAFKDEGEMLVFEAIETIRSIEPEASGHIELTPEPFLEVSENIRLFMSRYLESDVEIKNHDVVLRFYFYWSEFTDILKYLGEEKRTEFFFSFERNQFGGTVKITCCDASELIKDHYDRFHQVIAFSATLKPFAFYSQLMGLNNDRLQTGEFATPFKKENRKILIIPQVSTRFAVRENNYARIAEVIEKVVAAKKGNYLAFFPSFVFLEKVASFFNPPADFKIIKQSKGMKGHQVEEVLQELKSNEGAVLFAVQGGVFSEGIDYKGSMAIGAFIIGPPLPTFDPEREMMKDFYQKHYQEGFNYAYTYPAMAKAVQCAGRVIRLESDRGIIVLMDERFLDENYSRSMPQEWFDKSPRELVSQSILKDLREFWQRSE